MICFVDDNEEKSIHHGKPLKKELLENPSRMIGNPFEVSYLEKYP